MFQLGIVPQYLASPVPIFITLPSWYQSNVVYATYLADVAYQVKVLLSVKIQALPGALPFQTIPFCTKLNRAMMETRRASVVTPQHPLQGHLLRWVCRRFWRDNPRCLFQPFSFNIILVSNCLTHNSEYRFEMICLDLTKCHKRTKEDNSRAAAPVSPGTGFLYEPSEWVVYS